MQQVLDHGGVRQGGVCAPFITRHLLHQLCEPLGMRLVDDCIAPRHARPLVPRPVECGAGNDGLGHRRRRIATVEGQILAARRHAIGVKRVGPPQIAGDLLGIWIEQQLVGVEPMAVLRLVAPVRTKTVDQPRSRTGQVAVPHLISPFGQLEPRQFLATRFVENAQIDLVRIGGKDGEINPQPVECGAQGVRRARFERIGKLHGNFYPS